MRWLLAAVSALLLALPAAADVQIEDIVVQWRPNPAEVNLRVNLLNPDDYAQRGPVQIQLYVRGSDGEAWRLIKTWNNINQIAGNHRVARDYFPGGSGPMDPVLYLGRFELKAVVQTPDGRQLVREKRYP